MCCGIGNFGWKFAAAVVVVAAVVSYLVEEEPFALLAFENLAVEMTALGLYSAVGNYSPND